VGPPDLAEAAEASTVPDAGEEPAKRWFVYRHEPTVTTTGVPYVEWEWLRPDGSWSRDREGTLSFEDESSPGGSDALGALRATIERLREEADGDARPVNGLLLSPLEGDSSSLPPDAIRDHGHTWTTPTAGDAPPPADWPEDWPDW
jgi:hypothetical protein